MCIYYRIYEMRTEKKFSLRKLEKLSGVSKSQINAIENGKSHPNFYTLCLLADALDVDVSMLYLVEK